MLVIRLFRTGKRNQPFFKIVVNDKRKSSKAGRYTEEVGFYNPLKKERNLNKERIKYWLSVGAQPSATVHNMLVTEKIIEGKKISKHKKVEKKEVPAVPEVKSVAPEAKTENQEAPVVKEEKPQEAAVEAKPEGPAKTE